MALEGQIFRQMGRLLSISEQYIINCARNGYFVDSLGLVEPKAPGSTNTFFYTANGCNGGSIDAAFQFFKYNGFKTTTNYPITGQRSICNTSTTSRYLTEAKLSGFTHVYPSGDEQMLKQAIATIGPISVNI